jgi:hypothetical protein
MDKVPYIAPEIEVLEIVIEKGFATSPGNWDNGGGF